MWALGREGLETVVFTVAVAFSTSARGAVTGAAVGPVVALRIAFAIYRPGTCLNVALFFKVVGALLMVFAAGVLVEAVEDVQSLKWLPLLTIRCGTPTASSTRGAASVTSCTASSVTWAAPTPWS